MEIFPIGFLVVACGFVLTAAAFVFWVWVLIECLTKEPSEGNDKLIWALVIILTHWIGALIYYLVRRPERIRQIGY